MVLLFNSKLSLFVGKLIPMVWVISSHQDLSLWCSWVMEWVHWFIQD